MKFVEITDLSVNIKDTPVLKNINLTIHDGESVAVLGRGGSGKTTLLHVIRGIGDYTVTSGDVTYHGALCPRCEKIYPPSKSGSNCVFCETQLEPVTIKYSESKDEHIWHVLTKSIAIMLQRSFGVHIFKTVLDNVIESLMIADYPAEHQKERAMELLKAVNLEHRWIETGLHLSGGEKQRLVLARQLAKSPSLLLTDDPLSTLDGNTAERVLSAIQHAQEKYNITLIFTTQSQETVKALSKRAVLLDRGEIIMDGDAMEVVETFKSMAGTVTKKTVELGEPVIQVRDVKKKFYSYRKGLVKAVDGVSFDVYEGEIFGLIGHSGSGKTTLARLIAGVGTTGAYEDIANPLERAKLNYEGEIFIKEPESGEWISMKYLGEERGRVSKGVKMLFQEYALSQDGDILYNLTGKHNPSHEETEQAAEALQLVGFTREDAEKTLVKNMYQLSEDEKHRCAIARVLMFDPQIIILDEPSESMDPMVKTHVINTIHDIRAQTGKTFLIISHDTEFVRHLCDRVAHMKDGKITELGPTEEVLSKLNIVTY
jgi:methyl coenzyme M reductase system subunit A2